MKMLKRFTAQDLALASSIEGKPVKIETAKSYLVNIHRASYVRCVSKESWYFIKDTGAHAPQIQRGKHVFDPNNGERFEYRRNSE